MPKSKSTEPDHIRVLIVAPIWQQNVLNLWLQVTGKITFVTSTTSLDKIDGSTHAFATAYDWVILSTHAPNVCIDRDIQQIQDTWATAHLVVLVHDEQGSGAAEDTNSDITWVMSDTPAQLVKALGSLLVS
ncbi:MAG: hypothetical protein AAF639_46500 [Chloroflexota bacterium]